MQSGGGGGGGGPGRVGPGGRAPSTSSAAASPSSSSSAISTPQLVFESQQPQQTQEQLGSRQPFGQAFQQQMHRKPEANENLLAYQAGGFQGIMGGNNYASSPVSAQMPQQSRKFFELAQQYTNPSQDGQNWGPSVEQQVLNHQAYMQFAAAQQKSAAMLSQQQQAKMGMLGHGGSKDQEMRMGNMKMQELMSMQVAANQAQASSSKNSAEHFPRSNKHVEQGQQAASDLRNEQKSLSQPPVGGGQLMPSNVTRPMQASQPQANQNMGNSQLAMAQAMQAWALERNIDLSQPANANMVAQLIPLMQARMGLQHKANESGSGALSSLIPPPKQQVTSPSIGSDNSQNASSVGDVSGQSGPAKARQGFPPGSFSSSLNSGGNNTNNPSMQQFAFHNRETQVAPRSGAVPGNVMLPMHPPQSSSSAAQASNQSMPPKVVSSSSETTAMQHLRQLNRSPQPAGASSSEASPSTVQMSQQRTAFTKQQLHVLKAQILAFRRLKKGEGTLPQELLLAISPPPLGLQQQSTPAGTNNSDRSSSMNAEDPARNLESKEKNPQMISSINGPTITKQEVFVADEKPPVSTVHMQSSQAVIKNHISPVNAGNDGQLTGAAKAEQEVEQSSQRTPVRNDFTPDRGKAVAPQHATSDITEAKKPSQANALSQPKDAGPPRKYHGPLFDFPFFTRKHDSVGSSATANNNNNFVLSYSVRDIVSEEGSEVFTKKRSDNLKKINGLLAVNLERKRIRPDLVLRLQIEEKKLKLVDLQARLRDEVDRQQQEIMAMPDRPYRKFVRLCERQRTELSRQVQASQKALREKQWKSIFQWRKKLLEAHWGIRDARTARNRGVAKYHERMLREFSKRKDDDRNKRMEALKNNDVERYREMLMEQQTNIQGDASERYAVLSSFLSQTEEYLHKLGSKITAAKNQQEVEEAANTAAAAARLQGLSEEEVKAAAACAGEEVLIRNRFMEMNAPRDGSSVNKYYTLAHAVNERVTRQPSMLRAGTLRDYQLVGLQWMLSLYNNKLNGILADEMGLGKTVQVMALIAYLMEFKGNYGPHLIIVPNAVLVNWKSEFLNWLPSCSCIFYVGAKEQRAKLFSQEVCAMKFNVLVTTYEFIMFDRSKLSKIDWKYIIIDEAQRMKDRESVLARDLDRYRCQRRLLLTGTPLQNDLKELWSLLNLLLPEVFDNRKKNPIISLMGTVTWSSSSTLFATTPRVNFPRPNKSSSHFLVLCPKFKTRPTFSSLSMSTTGELSEGSEAGSGGGVVVGEKDLLVVGPGVLGRLVAEQWRQEHPGCQVYGQTMTTDHHDELINMGITPSLKGSNVTRRYPYIVFCAPPSRTADYPGDVRDAVLSWNGDGAFVFTSSSAPYDCFDNGACDENSPIVPIGRSPRTDVLLKAEKEVLERDGSVVRLAGLYKADRGAHVYWLSKGTSDVRPDHFLNLIHYEDAASLCIAILKKKFRGKIFLGCDNHPLSRQGVMDLVTRSGKFSKKFEGFTGTSDPLGKRLNNSKTREEVGWEPKYPSFAEFLGMSE